MLFITMDKKGKIMKKVFSIIMVIMLSFSLSACCLFPWWNPPHQGGGGGMMSQPQGGGQGGGMRPMQQPR